MEYCSDRGVKLNHFISLHSHLNVALLNLLVNPMLEVLTDEAVDHVADETSLKLHGLLLFG